MGFNFLAIILAALSTQVVGFIWYNPKVFGAIWMKETGIVMDEDGKPKGMAKLIIISLIYAFLIAFFMQFIVIHQMGANSAAMDIPNVDPSVLENYMKAYGETYRTFKHGALHGFMAGLLFALPLFGITSLYEKRSFKYVLVTSGYWIVCFMIMGGIICAMK